MALQPVVSYGVPSPVSPMEAFEKGQLWRDQQEQRQAARQKAEELKNAVAALPENASIDQINQVIFKYPELAERYKGRLANLTEKDRERRFGESMPVYAALVSGSPAVAEGIMRERATAARNAGNEEDAKNADAMAELIKSSPGTASTSIGMTLAAITGPEKFAETFSKLQDVQKSALLTPLEIKEKEQKLARDLEAGGFENHSVKFYANGVSRAVGKDGTVQVRSPSGRILENADADAALKAGFNSELLLAGGRAGAAASAEADVRIRTGPGIAAAEQASKDAVALSTEAFKKIPLLERQIGNYDEAIRLVEREGANTGVISSKFPSLTSSAVALDNLQKSMGLDIIATSLPGAASEGDVRMALQTALPTGLDGPELAQWLKDKKEATKRVLTGIKRVAKYMGKGNTVAQYLEAYADEAAPPAAPAGTVPANDLAAAAAAELARRRGGG